MTTSGRRGDVCEEEDNTACFFFFFFSKKMGRINCL